MHIEYSYHDSSSNEIETKEIISKVIKYPVNTISVLPTYLRSVKTIIPSNIELCCPIDYPLGIIDSKSRISILETVIKNGAKNVDIVCPSYILCNRKYDKFREEIKEVLTICSNNNIKLRYMLEYRIYSYELLYKIAQILLDHGVTTVLPSTGYLLDDINDNILACVLIHKKVANMNIICNGNVWNQKQVDTVQKADLYGLRVNSINALSIISEKSQNNL